MTAPTTMQKLALTTKEVGQVLGMSDRTIRRMIETGNLPSFRSGRLVRVSVASLEAWMARKTADNQVEQIPDWLRKLRA